MSKLGKSKFLTGMAVLFVIAAAAWGVLVLPANSAVNDQTARIKTAVGKVTKELPDLPGDQNIKQWADQADALKKIYGKALKDQMERDQALGQWFQGIDDSSTFATFLTPYDDQRQALEKELIDKGVELGSPMEDKDGKKIETRTPGFNWIQQGDIRGADTHEKAMQAKELLQKRFNICRYVADAVMADVEKGNRPRRLLDVTFLEKFPFTQLHTGPAQDSKAYTIPIDPKRYVGYAGPGGGNFAELLLPLASAKAPPDADGKESPPPPHLGRTLTFGFALVMDYHHIPTLIRNLIAPTGGPELNVTLVGVNVFVHDPNPEEKIERRRVPVGTDLEPLKQEAAKKTADCPPPQVHVYVTCQVFDFDPAAIPAFLKP